MTHSGTPRRLTRRLILLFCAGAVLLGLAGWVYLGSTAGPRVEHHRLSVGSQIRHYRMAIPDTPSVGKLPLVFAFHGTSGSPDSMAAGSDWDQVAHRQGLLVVYPAADGLWAVPGTANSEQLKRELAFYDRLRAHLLETYPIDRRRVYAIGMSHGANFAQYLAHQRSETLAAVVAHSHRPPDFIWESEPSRPVPLMLIIGQEDRQSSADSVKRAAVGYRQRGHEVELIVLPDWGHRWRVDQNQAMLEFLLAHRLAGLE
jgi:polyhydroxybutyrate depolymerase